MLDDQDKVLSLIEFTFYQIIRPTHKYFENTVKGYYRGMKMCSVTTEEETTRPTSLGAENREGSQR